VQRLGQLAGDIVLLDQQFLVAFQGRDLVPFQRNRTAVVGFDEQLATIEHADLAGQAIAVLQPDGIGEQRQGECGKRHAKQGSGKHK